VTSEGVGENKIYLIIACFVLVVVVFAALLSGIQLTTAYIPDGYLEKRWGEDLGERECGSQLLGLEKWCSFTYRVDGRYPAYLTITSIKFVVTPNENQLVVKAEETIEKALQGGIIIDNKSKITGERVLQNGHNTRYITFEGVDTSLPQVEEIKIIGEVWNCATSGTSIICIGLAQVTDNNHNNPEIHTEYWEKIVKDDKGTFGDLGYKGWDGLIYNVVCH
jgi:hypothetical protein